MAVKALGAEQILELKEAFRLFDKNGDGHVTVDELWSVLKSVDIDATEDEVKAIIKDADLDGNGTVEFTEFIAMMQRQLMNGDTPEDIRVAFRTFDRDGNGLIDADELRHVMNSLGEKLTEFEVQEMIREADKDGDGMICYKEFLEMMMK